MIKTVSVNRNSEQHKNNEIDYDKSVLTILINSLLSEKDDQAWENFKRVLHKKQKTDYS